eukprot:6203473-Pleurochrysis_carterae.AAC.1
MHGESWPLLRVAYAVMQAAGSDCLPPSLHHCGLGVCSPSWTSRKRDPTEIDVQNEFSGAWLPVLRGLNCRFTTFPVTGSGVMLKNSS